MREISCGQTVKVQKLTGEGPVKRRIMDMGITKGVEIHVRKVAPLGDPVEVTVRGYELSLRRADAEDIISAVEDKLEGIVPEEQKRFFAIKLLEKDDKISGQMKLVPEVSDEIKGMEAAFDDDTESIITNERYVYISSIIEDCVTKANKGKMTISDKIDQVVTNRFAALPIFALVMFAAYGFLVFNLLCAPCFAAMEAIKRGMNNGKWFWFAIGYQCLLAYVVSLCIYQIGTLITTGAFGVGTFVAFLFIIGLLYLLFRPYKESRTLNASVKGMAAFDK